MKTVKVLLDQIDLDQELQARTKTSAEAVEDYADKMSGGIAFPPVDLFRAGERFRMAHGFHRAYAAIKLGWKEIEAVVYDGDDHDALWLALGANRTNGLRLTSADQEYAIVKAIKAGLKKSQTEIASQIGCSQSFICKVISRNDLTCYRPSHVPGADGKTYPASRARRQPRNGEPNAVISKRRHQNRAAEADGGDSATLEAVDQAEAPSAPWGEGAAVQERLLDLLAWCRACTPDKAARTLLADAVPTARRTAQDLDEWLKLFLAELPGAGAAEEEAA